MIGTNVRSGAHDLDSVPLGLTGHRHAVLEIDGPIVEGVQNVTVEVDHVPALPSLARV
jgi:hypothetical protein